MWQPTFELLGYIGPSVGFTVVGSVFLLLTAFGLLVLSILTWPFRLIGQMIRRFRHHIVGKVRRVVVVGLDGLDPQRTRRLMDEGRLPNLLSLADSGSFSDLRTTLPPISPVAWSSFMTCVNPGKHNIFDFLNRDLRTYLPELSSMKISNPTVGRWWKRIRGTGGNFRPLRKSQPFWKIRFAVCRCLRCTCRSALRISSMIGRYGCGLDGRRFVSRYPGGSVCVRIFCSVSQ